MTTAASDAHGSGIVGWTAKASYAFLDNDSWHARVLVGIPKPNLDKTIIELASLESRSSVVITIPVTECPKYLPEF